MARMTVQGMILDKLNGLEKKIDVLIPVVEGLKVKAAIAGGLAGLVGTGLITMVLTYFK